MKALPPVKNNIVITFKKIRSTWILIEIENTSDIFSKKSINKKKDQLKKTVL